MVRIFRKVRLELLTAGNISRYFRYATGEILLVVIGILLALQVNNWVQDREDASKERFILERIAADIADDRAYIDYLISKGESFIANYLACLDILLGNREASLQDFRKLFQTIRAIISFDQNTTTFDQIIATGDIDLINNPSLTESVVRYYNRDTEGWDSGLKAYSRNIIAPFLMGFDHLPQPPQTSTREDAPIPFTQIDLSGVQVQLKTLDDYRNSVFIHNILRERVYIIEGQLMEYRKVRALMDGVLSEIDAELAR